MRPDPRLVAHRGITFPRGDRPAPVENTVEALAAASDHGCAAVEFDVHATADGAWVMHHDPTLTRIHGLDLAIAAETLASLREAAPIPTLVEGLAALRPGCRPMVEVKPESAAYFPALAADLARFAALDPIVIVRGALPAEIAPLLPAVPLFLFEEDWERAWGRRGERFVGYDLNHEPVPDEAIARECARFAAAGRELAVWTIDDPGRALRWLEAGVPWVITNRVDLLDAALR